MIEVKETYTPDGIRARITGLKTATCEIYRQENPELDVAWWVVKTSRHSKGSIRYNRFHNYSGDHGALEYALGYAHRIARQRREREAKNNC